MAKSPYITDRHGYLIVNINDTPDGSTFLDHYPKEFFKQKLGPGVYASQDMRHIRRVEQQLARTKAKMDQMTPPQRTAFSRVLLRCDLFRNTKRQLQIQYNAQHPTNAWMKFHEILSQMNIIPFIKTHFGNIPVVNAFCNAELPGASICALNQKVKGEGCELEWHASSIMVQDSEHRYLGDDYGILEHNRDKWLMNDQHDGDATKISNLEYYEEVLKEKVELYTHDAGVGLDDHFENQERINLKIHLGCAIAGFKTLKQGGCFIAKQYTLFLYESIVLVSRYMELFDEFYIVKPQTSKPTNSEIYLVGLGFNLQKYQRMSNLFETWLEDTDKIKDEPLRMPQGFSEVLNVYKTQIKLLEALYISFYSHSKLELDDFTIKLGEEWKKKNPIKKITNKQHIPSKS